MFSAGRLLNERSGNMIPEGYEKLAVIGIAYKGAYDPNATYGILNAVFHEGSTYVSLKDSPVGPPAADGANWQYLAKGFVEALLSTVTATDTSGLIGTAGADVGAQDLMDAIADRVATKLLARSNVINNLLTTEEGFALDARQGKELKDELDIVNRDFGSKFNEHGQLILSALADAKIILQSTDADNYSLISFRDSAGNELAKFGYNPQRGVNVNNSTVVTASELTLEKAHIQSVQFSYWPNDDTIGFVFTNKNNHRYALRCGTDGKWFVSKIAL